MAKNPLFPPNFKDTVQDTTTLVNSLIARMADAAGSAGNKWIDGFTKDDVSGVVDDINAKFKDQVLDAWATAEADVKPAQDAGNP